MNGRPTPPLNDSSKEVESSVERADLEQHLTSVPGFLFTTRRSPEGVISMPFASRAICDFFGLQPGDVAASLAPLLAAIHPDDQARVAATIEKSGRHLSLCNVEFRVSHPDTGDFWLEARSMPVCAPDGSILWHGLMIDVTSRKETEQRLQQALEFTEGIINAIPDLLFELDLDGRYLNVWAQNPELLAAQKELLLGNTIANMLAPAAAEVAMSALREADEKGFSFGKIMPLRLPAGEHWFELSVSRKPGSDAPENQPSDKRFIALSRDVTVREQAMHALQRSQASLAEAQRIGQMGNWELDLVSGVLNWSAEIFRIFEIDPAQFGASYAAFLATVHPEDREALNRAYSESLANRLPYDFEHRLLLPDGRIKYVHECCETFYTAAGTPLRSHGTVQDITKHRQAAQLLHQRGQEFRALVENSPDIIIRYGEDLRRLYVNPAFEKLCGLPASALLGKRPVDNLILPREVVVRLQDLLTKVWKTGREADIELSRTDETGQRVCHMVRAVPEFNPLGEVVSVLTVARDITALKAAENLLAESRERLRDVAMQRNAEQEAERKRLAGEVHEGVGQQLMALRLNLSMLENRFDADIPAFQERVRKMLGFVDKSVELVRQVTTDLRPSVLDLGIVSALEWLVEEFAGKSDTACELRVSEQELAMDEQTATTVFRIVEETLANVASHAQAERVKIALERRGTRYFLEVQDNGKGFDLERLHESKAVGLAWMREQVAALKGEFMIVSQPNRGTVLTALLPVQEMEQTQ
ncbi:MAG: PAS domain-containing protein [Sulfuricella sp.]|nr:PAS domain-containing protein [Sulfuricella sp.]